MLHVWENGTQIRKDGGAELAVAVAFFIAFALATSCLFQGTAIAQTADRQIDTSKSTARFSVTHIWVERVTGTIPIESGTMTMEANSLIPQHASAILDPGKVSTDEPDRDNQLASPDFFDSKKFPTWTFVSTKVTPQSANAFEMDGNLTIHGVTQPEKLNCTVTGDEQHPVYHATTTIDRHAFGMATTRLDPTIGGTADIMLDVTLR